MSDNDLADLFSESDPGAERMFNILRDPLVSQMTVNRFDRIFYVDQNGPKKVTGSIFSGPEHYIDWVNALMRWTDVGYTDVRDAHTSIIEGSFDPDKTDIHGSIHICTKDLTRADPIVTVRKQPKQIVTLDKMCEQGMMTLEMKMFLEQAMYGRSNMLISGGSGAGKTTLARALSWYIDPSQRVLTAEEIDELHLGDRLPNVASLTTKRVKNELGQVIRETTLEDLVKESLRMRADRIWVGETRGAEALALVKACNSGHDGSVTTVHADDAQSAWKQLTTYVVEAGLPVDSAREQIARAFDLIVQISRVKMGRRVIWEITELESVQEGTEVRRNPLFRYNQETEHFEMVGQPTPTLMYKWQRYGVNIGEIFGGHQY